MGIVGTEMGHLPADEEAAVQAPRRVPPALAGHTGYLLRLGFLRAGEAAAASMPPGLSPRYYGVLTTLTELGARSQHELSKLLHVNRTMMVKLIDAMEDAGLVERRRNPDDRRSYALETTPAGARALNELAAAADRAEENLTGMLTPSERQSLQHLLRAVVLAGEESQEIPGGLAQRTGYLVSIAHLRLRERFEKRLRNAGVAAPDFGTLATIAGSGPISQQAVAEQLGFTGTAVVQIVDRLEAAGMVERRRNPGDRRAYALELTPTGRDALRRADAAIAELGAELAAILGGKRQERELYELLRRVLGV